MAKKLKTNKDICTKLFDAYSDATGNYNVAVNATTDGTMVQLTCKVGGATIFNKVQGPRKSDTPKEIEEYLYGQLVDSIFSFGVQGLFLAMKNKAPAA